MIFTIKYIKNGFYYKNALANDFYHKIYQEWYLL